MGSGGGCGPSSLPVSWSKDAAGACALRVGCFEALTGPLLCGCTAFTLALRGREQVHRTPMHGLLVYSEWAVRHSLFHAVLDQRTGTQPRGCCATTKVEGAPCGACRYMAICVWP